jgi:hypothetical protein
MIFSSFIRLFNEETTVSLKKVIGVSELPAFTICPFLSQWDTYEKFELQKNYTINDLMRNSIKDKIYALLLISTEYSTK